MASDILINIARWQGLSCLFFAERLLEMMRIKLIATGPNKIQYNVAHLTSLFNNTKPRQGHDIIVITFWSRQNGRQLQRTFSNYTEIYAHGPYKK